MLAVVLIVIMMMNPVRGPWSLWRDVTCQTRIVAVRRHLEEERTSDNRVQGQSQDWGYIQCQREE